MVTEMERQKAISTLEFVLRCFGGQFNNNPAELTVEGAKELHGELIKYLETTDSSFVRHLASRTTLAQAEYHRELWPTIERVLKVIFESVH